MTALAMGLLLAWPSGPASAQDRPAAGADALIALVNAYRAEQGLAAVAPSASLAQVASAHARDLEDNPPAGQCNGHSWSNSSRWTGCCYTADHAQARCMWEKPRELTRGLYKGNGYEVTAWTSGRMTPALALQIWKGSEAHNGVITNAGIWARQPWKAMGAAISEHYAVLWFGKEDDPAGGR